MEYVYRNSPTTNAITASLTSTEILLDDGNAVERIPYQDITMVRLYSKSGHFFAILYRRGGSQVWIGSRVYRTKSSFDDYSSAYSSFVRILHFHLKNVAGVKYEVPTKRRRQWIILAILGGLIIVFPFILRTMERAEIDPMTLGAVISLFAGGALFLFRARSQRHYDPGMLPPESFPTPTP